MFLCLFSLFLHCYPYDVLIKTPLTNGKRRKREQTNSVSLFFLIDLNETKERLLDRFCFFAETISAYSFYSVFVYLLSIFELIFRASNVIRRFAVLFLFFPLINSNTFPVLAIQISQKNNGLTDLIKQTKLSKFITD